MFRRSVIVVAMLLSFVSSPAGAGGEGPCEGYASILFCGEMNNDCEITTTDALIALRMSVGQTEPADHADLNQNGTITTGDAYDILRMAVGSLDLTYDCADQYSVTATHVGTYFPNGTRTDNNYAVGWFNASDTELRNYFVFDISSIPGTITQALLHLASAPVGNSYYPNPSTFETFALFDVDTPIDTLAGGTGGVAAYDDLAEGTQLGGFIALKGQVRSTVDVPLLDAGIDYLNASSGEVVFGGAIATLAKVDENEYLFNSTNITNIRELVVRVE